MTTPVHQPSTRSLRGLDGINLLMADVRDGVGPYLSVYPKRCPALGFRRDRLGDGRLFYCRRDLPGAGGAAGGRDSVKAAAGRGLRHDGWAGCLLIVLFPHFWTVIAAQALLGAPRLSYRRQSPRFRLGSSDGGCWTGGSAGTKASTTPATSQPRCWRARLANTWAITGYSTWSAPSRWQARGIVTLINPREIDHERARGGEDGRQRRTDRLS